MSVETPQELAALRRVGALVRQTLDAMRAAVRPGLTTSELDDVGARLLRAAGARSAPQLAYGFPGTTCISVNDEIVHGVPGQRRIQRGDLVKIDVTAELDGYIADAAITVPVVPGGARAWRLGHVARAAFEAALQVARVGYTVSDLGGAIERVVLHGGFSVVRELCGHGVGRSIHEPPQVPNHAHVAPRVPLVEGLVLALEPIIAERPSRPVEGADGWTLRTDTGALAAHYEHTIVIQAGAPLVLTA
jgi:methionyl aminopeptidase